MPLKFIFKNYPYKQCFKYDFNAFKNILSIQISIILNSNTVVTNFVPEDYKVNYYFQTNVIIINHQQTKVNQNDNHKNTFNHLSNNTTSFKRIRFNRTSIAPCDQHFSKSLTSSGYCESIYTTSTFNSKSWELIHEWCTGSVHTQEDGQLSIGTTSGPCRI